MTSKCPSSSADSNATINPAVLFQRLTFVARRSQEKEADFFKYELCSHPLSLFDNNCMMRSADKHELAKAIALLADYDPLLAKENNRGNSQYIVVIDGGWLLHQIPWMKNETYEEIFGRYLRFLEKRYGSAFILFDGYEEASTKEVAHLKRARTLGREVVFTPSMKLTTTKEEFLSCTKNKSRFIKELANYLKTKGFDVSHAKGDADLLIVQTAIFSSKTQETVLIGEDTDLLCLLLHYSSEIVHPIYFKSEAKRGKEAKIWDIIELKKALGDDVCKSLLFAHAILGCDTTSKPFGIGKTTSLKLLTTNFTFQSQAAKFYEKNIARNEIMNAGEMAMIIIYGGPIHEGINTLRYKIYQRKISVANSLVDPQEIPPTSAALKFHSQRVYYQVCLYIYTFTNVIPNVL